MCSACLHIEGVEHRDNMCPLTPPALCFINELQNGQNLGLVIMHFAAISCCLLQYLAV